MGFNLVEIHSKKGPFLILDLYQKGLDRIIANSGVLVVRDAFP